MMYLIVSAMSSEVRGSLKLSNIDPAPDTAPNSVETRPGLSCDKFQVSSTESTSLKPVLLAPAFSIV